MKPACKDCRYWLGDGAEGAEGDCRRYPPAKYGIMSATCFPTTLPEEWCGEFRPKETEAPPLGIDCENLDFSPFKK